MFVIGIDGGGTKTRVEIRDQDNRLQERKLYGAFNLNSIGENGFRSLLREIFSEEMSQCAGICIGAAGVSNPKVSRILNEVLKEKKYGGPCKLCGDQEIALRGAMDGPGIAVIAGTGSICFGKNAAGETARSGGYGHLIDDWGSGYALGREGLSMCVRVFDGREEETGLCGAILKMLNISSPEELVTFVYSGGTRKSDIAALAAAVLRQAEMKDTAAIQILHRQAEEIVKMVRAVQNKLNMHDCPIALLGGLFSSENPYCRIVREKLGTCVCRPCHDALWGAAQMAWEITYA